MALGAKQTKNEVLQQKKIIYIGGDSGGNELMFKLSQEVEQRHNTTSFYISTSKIGSANFKELGVKKEQLYEIDHLNFKLTKKPDKNYLHNAEMKYNFRIWDIWQVAAKRKKSRLKLSEDSILSLMESICKKAEWVAQHVKPDYAILCCVAGFHLVMMIRIFEKYGIKVLDFSNPRLPERFCFANELASNFPLLNKIYSEKKEKGLTASEIKESREIIQRFKEEHFKPSDSTRVKESWSQIVRKYQRYLKIIYQRRKIPNLVNNLYYPLKEKVMRRFMSKFEKPVAGEKYVLFFLHVQPEASTSIMGKWYENQLNLIENIVRSLPCDYKLYVKEHVWNFSTRPRGYHHEIKKFPSVRLITPFSSSYELITNSSAIVTITGTVGWEGILLQKPVITFGNVFYNIFDQVQKVENIEELPAIIKKRIDTVVDLDQTLTFVSSVLASSFPGLGMIPADCQNRSLEPNNIKLLVDGLEKHLAYLRA